MKKLAIAFLLVCGVARAERPWIGVELDRGAHGPKIKQVFAGTPGERAKLRAGDEILAVDGVPATSPEVLVDTVTKIGIGGVAKLRVVDEAGRERTVALTLESKPPPEKLQNDAVLDKPAPDFEPAVQVGKKVGKISSLRGQVVLIDFFATWCGPCREAMPEIERWSHELGARGLRVVGVSTEDKRIVAQAAAKLHVTYPLAADEDEAVSRKYRVFALPTMVVIDRAGVVRAVAVNDSDVIRKKLDELLGN